MNSRFYIIIISAFFSLLSKAQVSYTDYQNPFSQTYLLLNNYGYAAMGNDESNIYMLGKMQVLGQERGFIFAKKTTILIIRIKYIIAIHKQV